MKIGSANGTIGVGVWEPQMQQGNDSFSKNIQNQIQAKQQELQKLSENENMSLEEKMKKRQEIQQEISDLNMQLRQHQIEQRREQQQAKGSSMDDMLGGKQRVSSKSKTGQSTGMSQATMTAIISADSSMKQAQVQGNVAEQNEGKAGILKSEIKLDAARGGDTRKKEEELAEVEQKAAEVTAAQMNTLSAASKTLEEAAEADRESGKTDSGAEKDTKKAEVKQKNVAGNDEKNMGIQNAGTQEISTPESGVEVSSGQTVEVSSDTASVSAQGNSVHVDVRL